jgi:hypothetical protein
VNPERLRRALARPNEATHPVELQAWVDLPWEEHLGTPSPLDADASSEPSCEVCLLPDDVDDPVAHFRDPRRSGEYVMAHGDCGEANGLELA